MIPRQIGKGARPESVISYHEHVGLCTSARAGVDFIFDTFSKLYKRPDDSKILTVRHPIFRFYSVWNSLFQEGNAIGRELLRAFSNFVPPQRVVQSDHIRYMISFKTFLKEFLSESVTWIDHVPGLKPQVEVCNVCIHEWDYIVKLETWAEDAEVNTSYSNAVFNLN